MYAGLQSSIKIINGCVKVGEHDPCAYSIPRIETFYGEENKMKRDNKSASWNGKLNVEVSWWCIK